MPPLSALIKLVRIWDVTYHNGINSAVESYCYVKARQKCRSTFFVILAFHHAFRMPSVFEDAFPTWTSENFRKFHTHVDNTSRSLNLCAGTLTTNRMSVVQSFFMGKLVKHVPSRDMLTPGVVDLFSNSVSVNSSYSSNVIVSCTFLFRATVLCLECRAGKYANRISEFL